MGAPLEQAKKKKKATLAIDIRSFSHHYVPSVAKRSFDFYKESALKKKTASIWLPSPLAFFFFSKAVIPPAKSQPLWLMAGTTANGRAVSEMRRWVGAWPARANTVFSRSCWGRCSGGVGRVDVGRGRCGYPCCRVSQAPRCPCRPRLEGEHEKGKLPQ